MGNSECGMWKADDRGFRMRNSECGRRKEKKITGQGRLPLAAGRFQLLAVQRPAHTVCL